MDAASLKPAAGGGAPVVLEGDTALGKPCLLVVVFRHVPVLWVELFEVSPHPPGGLLVVDQLLSKALRQNGFGQIVTGGAKPAGGDDDIGPLPGNFHRPAKPGRVVPHHGMVINVDAQSGQLPGEHLPVGIGNVAQQQFGAHGDEFGGVRHMISLPFGPMAPAFPPLYPFPPGLAIKTGGHLQR